MDPLVMLHRMLVDAGDFAISFLIHFSIFEILHHDIKSHWEKWKGAVSTNRQAPSGAGLRRRIADLQCTQSPLLCNFSSMASFSDADPEDWAFEFHRQEGFRHPRTLQEVSQSRRQEREVTEDRGV